MLPPPPLRRVEDIVCDGALVGTGVPSSIETCEGVQYIMSRWFGHMSCTCRYVTATDLRLVSMYYEVAVPNGEFYNRPPWMYGDELFSVVPEFVCRCSGRKEHMKVAFSVDMDTIVNNTVEMFYRDMCSVETGMRLYEHYLRILAGYPNICDCSPSISLSEIVTSIRFNVFERVLPYSEVLIERRWIYQRLLALSDFVSERLVDLYKIFENPKTLEQYRYREYAILLWQSFINCQKPFMYKQAIKHIDSIVPPSLLLDNPHVWTSERHEVNVEFQLGSMCSFNSNGCDRPIGGQ